MPYATGKSQDGDTTELLPADFIVSDRDSLGWFYALVVLGHKLFNATPFRNAIVPGTLLPNDVAYKRYYPQPDSLFRKAGADATRLYFVSSAVMRGKAMLLREGGIREMVSQILVPLWSMCHLMTDLMENYKQSTGTTFVTQVPIRMDKPENVTDRWILSCCQRLVHCVNRHLQGTRSPHSKPSTKLGLTPAAVQNHNSTRSSPSSAPFSRPSETSTSASTVGA